MARKTPRNKIVISDSTSEKTRIFGTRFLLTYNVEKYLRRGDLVEDPQKNLSEALMLAKKIFEIEGIQAVLVDQYDVYVTIGRAFSWLEDGIEFDVHRVIRQHLEVEWIMKDALGKPIKSDTKKDPDNPFPI